MATFSLSLPTKSVEQLDDDAPSLNTIVQNKTVEKIQEQIEGVNVESVAAEDEIVVKSINPLDVINERLTEIEAKMNIILSELYGPTINLQTNLTLNSINYPGYISPSGEGLRKVVRGSNTGFSKDSEITVTSHFSLLNQKHFYQV